MPTLSCLPTKHCSLIQRRYHREIRFLATAALIAVIGLSAYLCTLQYTPTPTTTQSRSVKVLGEWTDSLVARKVLSDLQRIEGVNVHLQTTSQQRQDLLNLEPSLISAVERFDTLVDHEQTHIATLIWQYAMASQSTDDTVVLIYADAPVLLDWSHLLQESESLHRAVLGSTYLSHSIQSSLLILQRSGRPALIQQMLQLLLKAPLDTLMYDALYIPRHLYSIVEQDVKEPLTSGKLRNWYFYEQTCSMEPFHRTLTSTTRQQTINHACPQYQGYCCTVHDPWQSQVVLLTAYPILPWQAFPSDLPSPFNSEAGHFDPAEIPYIATISEVVHVRPDDLAPTPNFFDTLLQNDCLPSDDVCARCLSKKTGADCNICAKVCPCYCKTLCHEKVPPKFVAKEWTIHLPRYYRDPQRLVPRIIHQTWYETLSQEKYPHMSRFVQSFKQSGWEYKFYNDEEAGNFLSTHFPSPVRQAYDTLRPGAFKADLFRYCVLLIHGGIYADVDILLEASLDYAVPPDVAFMVPMDEPGTPVHKRMCLWNGLIAASPGHPYLAKAIETVVNQVRNRFTSVDVDATFCPDPEFSILHAFDTLFTAGPCLLGASINRVMERHPQTPFKAGVYKHDSVPGRSVILQQDKWDMGAHRFTNLEHNLIVAATDLPDADDRANKQGGQTEHYSKTHAKTGIYGVENLYTDRNKADEDIRITIASNSRHSNDGKVVA